MSAGSRRDFSCGKVAHVIPVSEAPQASENTKQGGDGGSGQVVGELPESDMDSGEFDRRFAEAMARLVMERRL